MPDERLPGVRDTRAPARAREAMRRAKPMHDDVLSGPTITRAMGARAREAPTVLRIRPMAGLRTPRVLVEMKLPGGPVIVFTLARRQRGALELRAPQAADGGPGVVLTQREGNRLASIAIEAAQADPRALEALKRRTLP